MAMAAGLPRATPSSSMRGAWRRIVRRWPCSQRRRCPSAAPVSRGSLPVTWAAGHSRGAAPASARSRPSCMSSTMFPPAELHPLDRGAREGHSRPGQRHGQPESMQAERADEVLDAERPGRDAVARRRVVAALHQVYRLGGLAGFDDLPRQRIDGARLRSGNRHRERSARRRASSASAARPCAKRVSLAAPGRCRGARRRRSCARGDVGGVVVAVVRDDQERCRPPRAARAGSRASGR